ncbi:hypothetical protein SNE40_019712 [Patella caerulea]|uniref:C2H2-type domain-containing protein n=1 Tax=Patella caerulea TaxID=87958 RepID=A0AAN8J8Y8_PATCE
MSEQRQQLQLLSDNEETGDINIDKGDEGMESEYCSYKKERKKKKRKVRKKKNKAKEETAKATDETGPSNLGKFQTMSCPNLEICGIGGSSAGDISGMPHGNEIRNTFKLKDITVDSCEFRLVCEKCFKFTGIPGMFVYNENDRHSCLFNKLAAKHKRGTQWFQIRKRFSHFNSFTSYRLCESMALCKKGEMRCSFAHNVFEQYFWNLEKKNEFHISECILRLNLERLLNEFSGSLIYLCQKCYDGNLPKANQENIHGFCQQKHNWEENKILVHSNHSRATCINNKPDLPRHAAFRTCKYLKYCNDRKKNKCVYAHSEIENEIWNLEHHCQVTREEIVRLCHMISKQLPTNGILENANRSSETNFKGQKVPRPKLLLNAETYESKGFKSCPYKITRLCKLCLKSGKEQQKCGLHTVKTDWVYRSYPDGCIISPLPPHIPKNLRFTICEDLKSTQSRCYKDKCNFAHSSIEIEIWKWMVKNDTTLDDMVSPNVHQTYQEPSLQPSGPVLLPADVKLRNYYCEDCCIQFDNLKDINKHTQTNDHKFNVEADKVQQWNCRQPPWNKDIKSYQLCSKTDCTYSHVSDQFNYCQDAHGQPELNEWKERYTHRQMARNMLKDSQFMSHAEKLLRYYRDSLCSDRVLCNERNGISISCNTDLNVRLTKKKHTWKFTVKTNPELPIKRLCLLLNRDRHNFNISTSTDHLQFIDGTRLDQSKSNSFTITVLFQSFRDGYFVQWVVFEFGSGPAVVRKLTVETCAEEHNIPNEPKCEADVWTKHTREIITDPSLVEDEFTEKLLTKYEQAMGEDRLHAFYDRDFPLNRYNYQHKMHKLLKSEELTRRNIIARYNLVTMVTVKGVIEDETFIFAQSGELFARISLSEDLSEDTDEGRLFLESVQGALIKPTDVPDKRVYEVGIAKRDKFKGIGKDYIYLELHPTTVKLLRLQPDTDIEMEIQFQMNRGTFCRMHHAIDSLSDVDIVFPNLSKLNVLNWNEHERDIRSDKLNGDQTKAVKHMVTKKDYSPPLIVYGPFGTGKTETLAEATKYLFQHQPQSRILICTYTNSAADIYYIKYLGDFLKERGKQSAALHIYTPYRRYDTVPTECHPYMLFSKKLGSFYLPTKDDLLKKRIVITTVETAIYMTTIDGIRGFFSHIFLDEAAQSLECQALMPLTLADAKTCIVLTGDHRQMNPKIYSSESKRQMFGRSILERLHTYYERCCKERRQSYECISIFLNQNYRSHCQLLKFISATFYGNEDHLICRSNLPNISLNPINFFSVFGKEVHTNDSTSFYNEEEADEIVNGVSYIFKNWPKEWGERKSEDIQVVAPYSQQVALVRRKLRMNKLRNVNVERIYNIQGKQFRILFISTVRTLELCEGDHMKKCLQGLEDVNMGEYGFLSEPNMLNTALTRAQSLVAVVGHPIALCTIGECSGIWKKYIKQCHELGSLLSQWSYTEIKQAVEERESSPLGAEIRRLSDQNWSRKQESYRQDPAPRSELMGVWSRTNSNIKKKIPSQPGILHIDHTSCSHEKHSMQLPDDVQKRLGKPFKYGELQQPTSETIEHEDYDDWDDFRMKPDEIIQKLGEKLQCPTTSNDILVPAQDSAVNSRTETRGAMKYGVKEERGRAVIYPISKESKRILLTEKYADDNLSDSSDEEFRDDEDNPRLTRFKRTEYKKEELRKLLEDDPENYKRCIINTSSEVRYARVMDFTSAIKEIQIRSRTFCGRALNNDEVVVLILPNLKKPDKDLFDNKPVEIYGEVVGILKRAMNPRYKVFVCRTDPINTGLMIPINNSIPPIFNLTLKDKERGHRDGQVIVYKRQGFSISFDHYETIDPIDKTGKLFLVTYLRWNKNCRLPLGIVIGVQPVGNNIETGMSIIIREHHIQTKFKGKFKNLQTSKDKDTKRLDFTKKNCFTIDPTYSQDLDDALSIEEGFVGTFIVGIHIADVSHFIEKDSDLDKVAYKRGTSYYPIGKRPIHMLPSALSTSMCSLLPHEVKPATSVFLTVNKNGEIITGELCQSNIQSKRRFNYEEVQDILNRPGAADEMSWSVKQLADIARIWRTKRMGRAHLHSDVDVVDSKTAQAHLMVAEFMIMANHQVASLVLSKFPQCCPLRIQRPPDDYKAETWRRKHFSVASNSVSFTRAFTGNDNICRCVGVCSCLNNYIEENSLMFDPTITVPFDVWTRLCDSIDFGDWQRFIQVLLSPQHYPQSAVALAEYRRMQDRAFYVCSANFASLLNAHYSLNLPQYTHFTSPIRRYFDIVVHRMVSACINNTENPYSESEMADIAHRCNIALWNSNSFDKSVLALHLSVALEKRPLIYYPVIEEVDDVALTLVFPNISWFTSSQRKIKMGFLAPSKRPFKDDTTVELQWEERIYNVREIATDVVTPVELKEPMKSVEIPCGQWHHMLNIASGSNPEKIISEFKEIRKNVGHMLRKCPEETLTSELRVKDKLQFFRKFFVRYRPNMHVKVQLAPVLKRGLLVPQIQLYFLTCKHIICMEHKRDPIGCFTLLGSRQASKKSYTDLAEYASLWLPVLAMESVTCSVKGQEQIFVHDVPITWCENFGNSTNVTMEGTFMLTAEFCQERDIQLESDYVCVRYNDIAVPIVDDLDEKVGAVVNNQDNICFVCHCVINKIVPQDNFKNYLIQLKLHECCMPFPRNLISKTSLASIEIIPKSIPHRRSQNAVETLMEGNVTQLTKEIALGKTPHKIENYTDVDELLSMKICGNALQPQNDVQVQVTKYALCNPFTLIQGPPGTGKTVTGAYLAFYFVMRNKSRIDHGREQVLYCGPSNGREQVLYCGPSNRSVDVVVDKLLHLGENCPNIIRVYSKRIENMEYPLPRDSVPTKKRFSTEVSKVQAIRDRALHHLIRAPGNSHSDEIKEFDCLFQPSSPDDIDELVDEYIKIKGVDKIFRETLIRSMTDELKEKYKTDVLNFKKEELKKTVNDELIKKYKREIYMAKIEELNKADIILSTCFAIGGIKTERPLNIKQIIIDESGMCTEPETMIPLTSFDASNIVLIGDHKQLQPILTEQKVKQLGLQTSLFERYARQALMLEIQYRMHEGIMEFPSNMFYDGKLKTGTKRQRRRAELDIWPNGRRHPTVLCHTEGEEDTLTVSTEDGSEQSKSNQKEVDYVVSVTVNLVEKWKRSSQKIAILSQYRAQCSAIKGALRDCGLPEIHVSTVVASQGSEWEYVIFSTVRSLPIDMLERYPSRSWIRNNLGFITDDHQLNVAITRAKQGLIIIGNKHLLKCDPTWKKLTEHYEERSLVVDAEEYHLCRRS